MKGADEYAKYIDSGQYGKLFIVSGSHARGRTFRIWILPKGEKAEINGSNNPPLNRDKIEVFGIISGNPGWTEEYGWLHKGKWVEDFNSLLADKKKEIILQQKNNETKKATLELNEKNKIELLLSNY